MRFFIDQGGFLCILLNTATNEAIGAFHITVRGCTTRTFAPSPDNKQGVNKR